MVNDFILKNIEIVTAALDIRDFTYGILMGMMERVIPDGDKLDETVLAMMK